MTLKIDLSRMIFRLDEAFRNSTLILNDEDDGFGFARLTSGLLVVISSGHQ